MNDNEKEKDENQPNQEELTLRTGEQFWEDLMNRPYDEDMLGQSFVILHSGQPQRKNVKPTDETKEE